MKIYIDGEKLMESFYDTPESARSWSRAWWLINHAKLADVLENVRGEWIDDGIHGDWAWEQDGHGNCWHFWKCSRCGRGTKTRSNYCPNCGADMRGDKQ